LSEPLALVNELTEGRQPIESREVKGPAEGASISRDGVRPLARIGKTPWFAGFAIAASVLMIWSLGAERSGKTPAKLLQRSYVGIMGSAPSPSPALGAEDQNVELTLQGKGIEAARVLIVDADARIVVPWLALRESSSGFYGVLAPRRFATHRGALSAFVLYGASSAVSKAVERSVVSVGEPRSGAVERLRAALERGASAAGAHLKLEPLRLP
jgi:hypothetical protein